MDDKQVIDLAIKAGLHDEMWFGPHTPDGYEDCLPKLKKFAQLVIEASSTPYVYIANQCLHANATYTIGPTTDQRNWWCPNCSMSWNTWPTDEERAAIWDAPVDRTELWNLLKDKTLSNGENALAYFHRVMEPDPT